VPVADLSDERAAAARRHLSFLAVPEAGARLDLRGGRFATLIMSHPLLPGSGRANNVAWATLGVAEPLGNEGLREAAVRALRHYLSQRREELAIDLTELAPPRVEISDSGALIQMHVERTYFGVPVRGSFLTVVISHGNLVLLGAKNWGTVDLPTTPELPAPAARAALASYLEPFTLGDDWQRPQLFVLPTAAQDGGQTAMPFGQGYHHRLAWALRPRISGDPGNWEALVDADSGEILSFVDTNRYDSPRRVSGGVFPATNDGRDPEGLEQTGYPMPYVNAQNSSGDLFTDSGGNLSVCVNGDITTSLDGQYAVTEDFCGALSESSSGDIDLGTSTGTDCAVPTGGSPGNTHSARTVFYTLNRMRETGLGQLPGNKWLERAQLPAISNFPSESFLGCNALWDGSGVLFTTSALPNILLPVACSNTGELAPVVAHEWAHGLDDNDANGNVSNPPEGIADVLASLWFNDSCIGRGFYKGTACSSETTPDGLNECLACDGVREIDWRQRADPAPHNIAYIDTFCSPPFLSAGGPCGGSVHCEGHLVSEAAWDLAHHDLQAEPFNLDSNTALEVTARLFYVGSGLVGDWFQCSPGTGAGDGCNADSGYLNLLTVDDDNGNLADGTPHMSAIHAAFERHGIACDVLEEPVDSGCDAAPTVAPSLSVQPLDRGASLSWDAVVGATRYQVFRNEGVAGCSSGKTKVGETTGLSFVDQGLQNGFEYNYMVLSIGASDACMGPASNCAAVVPTPGANLGIDESSATLTFFDGDGDSVIDNCESAALHFDVHNIGGAPLSNVVVSGIDVLSHPGAVTVTTGVPTNVDTSLGLCEVAPASFTFLAEGLSFNDTVAFRVHLTADELAGRERSIVLRFGQVESDFQSFASKTFDFEADLGGWEVVDGTFDRTDTGGGAQSSSYYVASSDNVPNRCDQIRSPLMRLQPTSTLSVWNSFDTEPFFDLEGLIFWFDRANVGVVDPLTGVRTPIDPDSGRLYNAGGTEGTCATANQLGWAGSGPTWAESTWSASALGSPALAGEAVQLDVAFGTDDGNWDGQPRSGFWFDQVTVTDLDLLVEDAQSDVCESPICDADSTCDPGETSCNCAIDCGAAHRVLTDLAVDVPMAWQACSSITAGPNFSVVADGDATLQSPFITLRNGVSVAEGASFQAGN